MALHRLPMGTTVVLLFPPTSSDHLIHLFVLANISGRFSQFWSIIEFTNTRPALLALLKKSKSNPLEIKCISDGQYNCAPRMDRMRDVGPTYFELLASHMHRIRSLIVLTLSTTDGILALLEKPAPLLEELNPNFRHCPLLQPVELFLGQGGKLKDVVLEHLPVLWDSEVLVGLRSLKMKAKFVYPPMEMQVLRLLESNPELEKLDIQDMTTTETETSADEGLGFTQVVRKQGRLIMGKMQELTILNLPFQPVRAALSNVEIPSIKRLDLECQCHGQPASKLLGPKIQHLVPPILQRLAGTELAEVTLGQDSLGLAIYLSRYERPPIRIRLKNTAPISGFCWLAEHIFTADGLPAVGAPEIFQVSLKFGGSFDMERSTFIPLLDWLDVVKVKDLTIERGCSRVEELIKYLGEIQED
ncbi:hypothetical protein FS837_012401 [Tulasnella sp. UAMH 9824]|nr:hypothetical protein FS837_012401 [Tulasnella sp. UAMH 9824]